METRRQFFQELIAGGVGVKVRPARRNQRAHHHDVVLYRGPLMVPAHVAVAVADHPALARTTSRHIVMRYTDGSGAAVMLYRFRGRVPDHRGMIGEVVRTLDGSIRVHAWNAADPGVYLEPLQILAREEG